MLQLGIIFAAAAFFIVLERIRPGRHLPAPAGWFARAAVLNAIQLAIVVLAGFTWNKWFTGWSLFHIAGVLPAPAEGALAWFIGTFVFYWWHRIRHASDFAWRVLHQVHHSPARIEAITSFYKHPLEIAANSIISSALVFGVLGGSVEAAAWFNVFAAIGEMCYHSNLRTPKWFGYFLQRPEHHSIHHEYGVHNYNFGDITWWDRLFGTFRDVDDFAPACGFEPGAESQLGRMLLFKEPRNERAA
jgi:sterol desaturase/sphingolipid hydroxylase (fatty acid hydroxylase superfamily)